MAPTRAEFPEKLEFLFRPARYKVLYGGRGGAKSWGVARALLILGAQRKLRILCARELQKSIADSVHKLLKEQIEALGLNDAYEVLQTTIRGTNGTEFIFTGFHGNATQIKSMEGVDIVWVEEAQAVSAESWDVLIPTIRKDGSEIWVTFNPDLDTDPTYTRFVVDPPPGAVVVEVGWKDNPWLPEVLRAEKDHLYTKDPESADHVWGGKTRRYAMAQILRNRYVAEAFMPQSLWHGPYFGADWGFANDPTVLVKLWINERRLYVEQAVYGYGVDLDDTPALFDRILKDGKPEARQYTIRADSARPETISHMRRHGYTRIIPATKWPGSVDDGIEHLRSYEQVIIHPRCDLAKEQARLWSFKTDRLTGDVLPEQLDKHNDVWDATRYALEQVIISGRPKGPPAPKPKAPRDYRPKTDEEDWRHM